MSMPCTLLMLVIQTNGVFHSRAAMPISLKLKIAFKLALYLDLPRNTTVIIQQTEYRVRHMSKYTSNLQPYLNPQH